MLNTKQTCELRPFVRLSYDAICRIVSRSEDYTGYMESYYKLDENHCKNCMRCPVYAKYEHLKTQLKQAYHDENASADDIYRVAQEISTLKTQCGSSNCPGCRIEYTYVQHDCSRYQNAYASKRLPKTCVRLLLMLYAIPMEILAELGTNNELRKVHFIRNISIDVLANKLRVHKITIAKSIEILAAFNYISVSHGSSMEHYNIIINDYDTMSLPARSGGTGYIRCASATIEKLLEIKNVNCLRLELIKLAEINDDKLVLAKVVDSSRNNKSVSDYSITASIRDLCRKLPRYIYGHAALHKISQKERSMFSTIYDNRRKIATFSISDSSCLYIESDTIIESGRATVEQYLKECKLYLKHHEIEDIIALQTQYTVRNIVTSIRQVASDYNASMYSVKSFGALIRTYCQRNYIVNAT